MSLFTLSFYTMQRLIEKLKKVKDFRKSYGKRHQLWVVLLIIILAIMQSYTNISL
ncbi:transposase family protein [Microcystis panniformis]|uniref:Transposase family protein n=1 Tax=Microcystis aeruginosa BLCC-F108 TaxID=2755317 RepID=A0A841UMP1_MICAE|nr:transposase family protein [Microcystis panniformis]MBC1191335.1 transposase family protein [Microcystis aeruginosa BLCC-F108]MCA2592727.1 transposase family protein [Microcystis sp. M31BS1]TRT77235.1 MAG: transposase family protein [Microcystis sp. M_OC_Ca_00000000_S217Cul]TRT89418.1 MAG: transposase family protein [Microcystis sp. M_OC_Ca_00000000_C217Col]